MRFFLILLLILSYSSNSFATNSCELSTDSNPEFFEAMDDIRESIQPSKKLISCLEEFQKHPLIPDGAVSQFWHELDGQKVFAARCKYLDKNANEEKIFTFVTPDGIKTVTFPAFSVRVKSSLKGWDTASYPAVVMKFVHKNKDYYITEGTKVIGDDFGFETKPPQFGQKSFEVYNSLLKKNKLSTRIEMQTPSDDLGPRSCIDYQIGRFLDTMIKASPRIALPALEDMKKDYSRAKYLPEIKERYKLSLKELKAPMVSRFYRQLPSCKGVVDESAIEKILDQMNPGVFSTYESMRKSVYP